MIVNQSLGSFVVEAGGAPPLAPYPASPLVHRTTAKPAAVMHQSLQLRGYPAGHQGLITCRFPKPTTHSTTSSNQACRPAAAPADRRQLQD
jgi:hypothetical protein